MKALGIIQPWAWLIVHAGKDIENTIWYTSHRGPTLIHAYDVIRHGDYQWVEEFLQRKGMTIRLPPIRALAVGGIIGQVDLVDCVRDHDSPWFFGPVGFVLENPKPLPFIPYRGWLGLFDVPDALIHG